MFPRFDADAERELIAKGMNASPGAAVGKAVFDSDTAVEWAERGEEVILVRRETNPDDLHGMVAARGILTSRGGKTSHAAVVARGMGRTCVCGADVARRRRPEPASSRPRTAPRSREGDVISIDGTTGEVFLGEVPVDRLAGRALLRGRRDRGRRRAGRRRRPDHGARRRAPAGWPCGPTPTPPTTRARARRFGAQGIGLCRTEHMFLGERRRSSST